MFWGTDFNLLPILEPFHNIKPTRINVHFYVTLVCWFEHIRLKKKDRDVKVAFTNLLSFSSAASSAPYISQPAGPRLGGTRLGKAGFNKISKQAAKLWVNRPQTQ